MALSVALGATIGLLPALGWSTTLCAIAAIALRLNLPAIQIANYFLYPAQLALLVPFFRWGEKLFGAPHFPISVPQVYALFQASVWLTVKLLWTTIWHAMVVWGMFAPVFIALLYVILTPLLRRALPHLDAHALTCRWRFAADLAQHALANALGARVDAPIRTAPKRAEFEEFTQELIAFISGGLRA